jgi:hypothetical protein
MPVNSWSHLALTDDGAVIRLYVDGELVRTAPSPPISSSEGPLQLGGEMAFGNQFYGKIDEVRVYDRALEAGEVAGDGGSLGMTATYISEEEGEQVQAEASSNYPRSGISGSASSGAPVVVTSVTILGAPNANQDESLASPSAQSEIKEKPYQFANASMATRNPASMSYPMCRGLPHTTLTEWVRRKKECAETKTGT